MLNRCRNKNLPHWASYGGRGIKVCERWHNFECFLEDMGPRPSLAHSLDRINNDGNYEPGNVRWAVDAQQRRNKRNNVRIEIDGRRLVVADAARLVGVPAPTIYDRLRRGLSPEESIR
jgi:hypothetical protein